MKGKNAAAVNSRLRVELAELDHEYSRLLGQIADLTTLLSRSSALLERAMLALANEMLHRGVAPFHPSELIPRTPLELLDHLAHLLDLIDDHHEQEVDALTDSFNGVAKS